MHATAPAVLEHVLGNQPIHCVEELGRANSEQLLGGYRTKERGNQCYVYALPWPEVNAEKAFSARRIATLELPAVTAMDVSPDGRRAVVLTYENAYEFVRAADEDWPQAFSHKPREVIVPERVQGESICYGSDGKTLFLTSEQLPAPLLVVPVIAPAAKSSTP